MTTLQDLHDAAHFCTGATRAAIRMLDEGLIDAPRAIELIRPYVAKADAGWTDREIEAAVEEAEAVTDALMVTP